MGTFHGWEPETGAERDLLLAVRETVVDAIEAEDTDVDATDAAGLLAALASGICSPPPAPAAPPDGPPPSDAEDCPACGGEIADVAVRFGGVVTIVPCGCEVHAGRLAQHVPAISDVPEDVDDDATAQGGKA